MIEGSVFTVFSTIPMFFRRSRIRCLANKARCPSYEHVLAKQIIDLDLQLIAAKIKQFSSHPPAAHPF